jgi:hypothetical protein
MTREYDPSLDYYLNGNAITLEDIEYIAAERLGIDVEDLERCPKSVYDALIRYFELHA